MKSIARGMCCAVGITALAVPLYAAAATVTLGDPSAPAWPASSDVVALPVSIVPDNGECVNAAEMHFALSGSGVALQDVQVEQSEFGFWVRNGFDPSTGDIAIIGGTKDQFCGDGSNTAHLIATLVLTKSASGSGRVLFAAKPQVAAADGRGTALPVSYDRRGKSI